jgi:hypothetical protein
MGRDGHVMLARFVQDCPIKGRRQRLQLSLSVVHPDLDEGDVVFDVVLNRPSSLLFGCHRIHHVVSGCVAGRAGAGPGDSLTRRSEQRGIGKHLLL